MPTPVDTKSPGRTLNIGNLNSDERQRGRIKNLQDTTTTQLLQNDKSIINSDALNETYQMARVIEESNSLQTPSPDPRNLSFTQVTAPGNKKANADL